MSCVQHWVQMGRCFSLWVVATRLRPRPSASEGTDRWVKRRNENVISGVKSMMTEIMSFIAPFNPHLSVPELALALGRGRSRVADELALEFAVSKRASAHPGT